MKNRWFLPGLFIISAVVAQAGPYISPIAGILGSACTKAQSACWTPKYQNIVLYTSFDGPTGTMTAGSTVASTLGGNGTTTGNIARATSFLRESASFDTASTITYSASGLPVGSSSRTMAFWFKPTDTANRVLAFYGNDTTGNGHGAILLSSTVVRYYGWDSNCDATYSVNTDTWNHFVGTYDGTNARIYVNGDLEATCALAWNTASSTLRLGHDGSGNAIFNGSLDDFAIWNVALNTSEIQTLYSKQQPKTCLDIKLANASAADGMYTIDPDGAGGIKPFQAYCDMTTDGGGWTLAVNIVTELGPLDFFTYNNRSASPLTLDYGVNLSDFTVTSNTEYRLWCSQKSDSQTLSIFVKGFAGSGNVGQFNATAAAITTTGLVCSASPNFSSPITGSSCMTNNNGSHKYYGHSTINVRWALFSGANPQSLRHCIWTEPGAVASYGRIWFRK